MFNMFIPSFVFAFTPQHRGGSRIFLDTADTTEWADLLTTGIFHGVTTNPTLLERAGEPCTIENLHQLAAKALGHVSCNEFMCQAWGQKATDLYNCGKALAAPNKDQIVVKVPLTRQGIEAATMLVGDNIRVCLTACYNSKQALIASSVGAEYIAPYLGRMTDAGKDGLQECIKMKQIADGLQSTTRILVASLRDCDTVADLAATGLETFTIAPQIARQLLEEPLTNEAADVFEGAANNNGAGSDS